MVRRNILAVLFLLGLAGWVSMAHAQLGMLSKDGRIELTREWTGERFEDGRPKVSDALLEDLKTVDAEQAWEVLKDHGYNNQFESGWHVINPGERLVGRVVTAVFVPLRPDVNAVINERGRQEHRVGPQNSWPIDLLQPNDVLVVDLFGKIKDGTFAGDNLATSIFTKSHTGLIVDGAVRDETGILRIQGMRVFARGVDPSVLRDAMLMGINVPIRIGRVTVMPGDVVLSDPEGLTFIPPSLVQEVVEKSQLTRLRDEWGHLMLREGKYTPGEIDGKWSSEMIDQFNHWLAHKGSKIRMNVH